MMLLPWVAAAAAAVQGAQLRRPLVALQGLGRLQGVDLGGADAFLGIPYAQPPVGPLRFAPAVPVTAWEGTRDAGAFGPACWQQDPPDIGVPLSEDCLSLNVWRPAGAAPTARLPVLFWIHGGGMQAGGSARRWTHGGRLSAAQQVVVVSINYRLGPLGFLARPEIAREHRKGNGGANGIYDAITALRWVRTHIGTFGGDPARVTLFGESAGALSVCSMVASPLAEGLFEQAVLESGPCIGPWGPYDEARGLDVSHHGLQIDGRPLGNFSMAELRALPAEQLKQWGWAVQLDPQFPGYWADGAGGVLPQIPEELFKRRRANAGRFIVGFNSKDGLVPFSYLVDTGVRESNSSQVLDADMHARWKDSLGFDPLFGPVQIEEIKSHYTLRRFGGVALHAFVQSDADFNVICPSLELARLLARGGANVSVYEFAAGPSCHDIATSMELPGRFALPNETDYGWASHGAEIPFVFGTETGPGAYPHRNITTHCPFGATQRQLVGTLQDIWGRFAHSDRGLDPEASGWPHFGSRNSTVMRITFDGRSIPLPAYKHDACGLWGRLQPQTPTLFSRRPAPSWTPDQRRRVFL